MDRPLDDDAAATGRAKSTDDEAFSGLPIPTKGALLLGKYRVEGVVGVGGMGMVVAARHEHLNERVALKLLLPRYAELAETRKRFQREAQAAYKLRSEHVCRVLDAGELEDGTPFIAMEFLKGDDLAAELRKKKRIAIPEAVDYLLQACEALGEAHANEIVHRDLKPANLVVITRKDGTRCLKVIDFGISKVATDTSSELTNTYGYLGSPSYSAPEQFASTRAMTASGDLWSLGVILYEMVCGQGPFDFPGDGLAEIATTITHEPAVPMTRRDPSVDPAFARVVARCLEKDPADRYPRIRELAEALAPFAGTPPDDLLGRIRRHQPSAPAPLARPDGPRTAAAVAVVVPADVRAPSTVPLESAPVRQAFGSMPPPAPIALPMAPPVTRYAVVADPRPAAPAGAPRRNMWLTASVAALAFLSALAAVMAYRASHHATSTAEPATSAATLTPVPVPTATASGANGANGANEAASAAVVASAAASTVTGIAPPPSASTGRAGVAARPPPSARGGHHSASTAAAPADSGAPKILKDRDGKF